MTKYCGDARMNRKLRCRWMCARLSPQSSFAGICEPRMDRMINGIIAPRLLVVLKYLASSSVRGCIAVLFLCVPVVAQVNVLTYHNNNSRTGENPNETILTPANVNSLTFGKLFAYNVDGHVFAQPLYVSGLNVPGQGTHNVILIATEHNSV